MIRRPPTELELLKRRAFGTGLSGSASSPTLSSGDGRDTRWPPLQCVPIRDLHFWQGTACAAMCFRAPLGSEIFLSTGGSSNLSPTFRSQTWIKPTRATVLHRVDGILLISFVQCPIDVECRSPVGYRGRGPPPATPGEVCGLEDCTGRLASYSQTLDGPTNQGQ